MRRDLVTGISILSLIIPSACARVAAAADAQIRTSAVEVGDLQLELVYEPPGTFEMGRSRGPAVGKAVLNWEVDSGLDEGPKRRVKITRGFYIGRYKVTCEQFCSFLNSCEEAEQYVRLNQFSRIELSKGEYRPKKGCAKSAVNVVEWEGAVAFCDWLSRETGRKFRLPTEAEWEYAARGEEGRRHPWGAKKRNAGAAPFELCQPVHESHGDVTPEGVVGMGSGYLYEWCSDYYGIRYLAEDIVDPQGPTKEQLPIKSDNSLIATVEGEYRVLRGRSSVATRRFFGDRVGDNGVYGLRVVMEATEGQQ
jgi:formylglycine-generating enzyme required for sulfatase activity